MSGTGDDGATGPLYGTRVYGGAAGCGSNDSVDHTGRGWNQQDIKAGSGSGTDLAGTDDGKLNPGIRSELARGKIRSCSAVGIIAVGSGDRKQRKRGKSVLYIALDRTDTGVMDSDCAGGKYGTEMAGTGTGHVERRPDSCTVVSCDHYIRERRKSKSGVNRGFDGSSPGCNHTGRIGSRAGDDRRKPDI